MSARSAVCTNASIKEAGRLPQKWRIGSLLVDDGSRYIGIITDTDLSRKAVAKGWIRTRPLCCRA